MTSLVVTGSDTGVGKTVAAAWLCHQWGGAYFKPIQCGRNTGGKSDSDIIRALGASVAQEPLFDLTAPRSPHEASQKEGVRITLDALTLPPCDKPLIIEGAGGIMVPLNDKEFMLDAFALWNAPVILVVRTRLGTLNHSFLSLQALRLAGLEILGLICVGEEDNANMKSLEIYGKTQILAHIPPLNPLNEQNLTAIKPSMALENLL